MRASASRAAAAEVADLAEAESGQVVFTDRLRARIGQEIVLRLLDGDRLGGRLLDAAPQWLVIAQPPREVLVPIPAVVSAWPLGGAAPPAGEVEQRLSLSHALRELARQGEAVSLRTVVSLERGWIRRVGADHLDLVRDVVGGAEVTISQRHVLAVLSD